MSTLSPLRILNIGLDRALLEEQGGSESQIRQVLYAQEIPAEITHLVKAPPTSRREWLVLGDGLVRVIPVPVHHWAIFPFAAIRAAGRVLRQEKIDIIQAQEPILCGLVGLWLSRRYRVPLIVGAFTDQVANPAWASASLVNRLADVVGRAVYKQADAIRADSLAVMQRLQASGFPQASFIPFLITNAEMLVQPAAKAAIVRRTLLGDRNGPLLLAVARLESEKNMELMLQAVERIVKSMNGVVLAVVGDGSLRKKLEQRFTAEWVRWLGWVPNTELAAYYQAADLSLLSSDIESSARVLTESLLAGTPVLTTDTAGAREVVADMRSGRIVPTGDLDAFARALLELCENSRQLDEMGKYGQQMVGAHMSRANIISGLRQLCAQAIRRHQGEPVAV
jgi:glycosyltransferase involved in cell wall biosynthesis